MSVQELGSERGQQEITKIFKDKLSLKRNSKGEVEE